MADARKAYGLAPQRGCPSMLPTTMDRAQAAKILEQENMLRAAVNEGEDKGDSVFFFLLTCIESLVLGKKLGFCVSRTKIASRPETDHHCTSTAYGGCAIRQRCR